MNYKQTLTNEESERYAYISGDTLSADMFDNLMEYEPKDEWTIDECLDEVGEIYTKWASFDESAFTNKMHKECFDAHNESAEYGEYEYTLYGYSRGSTE